MSNEMLWSTFSLLKRIKAGCVGVGERKKDGGRDKFADLSGH